MHGHVWPLTWHAGLHLQRCKPPRLYLAQACAFSYEGVDVCIQEGTLGDGLGAKVWMVAHILCR